jgi:hypothetical protein
MYTVLLVENAMEGGYLGDRSVGGRKLLMWVTPKVLMAAKVWIAVLWGYDTV